MPQNINGNSYVSLSEKINEKIRLNDVFFSVEFFPPKSKNAIPNIITSFDHFRELGALYCDVTWHSNDNTYDNINAIFSIQVADVALNYCFLNTMIHLTCVGLTEDKLLEILERLKQIGIRNILALRGDMNPNQEVIDFHYASDLVRFIRKHYDDYFTIAVAGYPIKHPEALTLEQDIEYLKYKVDCGADFIITQLFFDSATFISFVQKCRNIGIKVPIIPGIMPIQSYDSFQKITFLSQLDIPLKIIKDLEPIKNNDEAVRNYGIDWTIEICRELLKSNTTPGFHFYTLNRLHSTGIIIKALNLSHPICNRPLPWLTPANHRRSKENVRPIFWSSRQKSYVYRTNTWDEFPNGRWGNVNSPAFGTLNDYHIFFERKQKKAKYLEMWGADIQDEKDVWDIFYCFIAGTKNKYGFLVETLPWNEDLKPETNVIIEKLSTLNKHGILTINSQPNINGVNSDDPLFGWGSSHGYVYQKAYIEFFITNDKIISLLNVLKDYSSINYQIINQKGNIFYTNCNENEPIAVTWGIFPGKEVIQPTIVDLVSFKVWKDEAFSLWIDKWAAIYPKESHSRDVLTKIYDNYCLVNLVDNDYPKDTCLWAILEQILID